MRDSFRAPVTVLGNVLLLALIYCLVGRISLLLAIPPGYATAIFPPTGIALAAILIWGNKLLPGVFLGSYILNAIIGMGDGGAVTSVTALVAIGIASGATLQTLFGAWLIRRAVGFPTPLIRDRDIIAMPEPPIF